MYTLLIVLHVIFCVFLILVILLQTGKGAGIGAAFGGGSQTVFGPRGAGSFIGRLTGIVAGLFMLSSLLLAYSSSSKESGVADKVKAMSEDIAKNIEEVDIGSTPAEDAAPVDDKKPAGKPDAAVAEKIPVDAGGKATVADDTSTQESAQEDKPSVAPVGLQAKSPATAPPGLEKKPASAAPPGLPKKPKAASKKPAPEKAAPEKTEPPTEPIKEPATSEKPAAPEKPTAPEKPAAEKPAVDKAAGKEAPKPPAATEAPPASE
ncbi:MAG: preprotein translocase subunit SecG [Deltaproteobacteria bacterium]|nr:preprotein translocase subunit SecG [Deltaproteobacteria bacterium]